MASASKSWIGVNSWVSCYLVVESKPNATGNYSDVTAKLYGARNDGGNSYNNSSSNFWININGTQTSRGGACQVSGSAWQLVHSQTTRVYHNDDGSKTITISAGGGITDTTFQMGSNSLSLTLDKIARKSSLSASNGTLGTAQTLTITKQNASYTDTITYKCGSASGTIVSKTTNKSVSWTPPIDLAKQNTKGTTVSITLTIETFNGSTSLGKNTKTITCSIPASVKPTVSISLKDMMGYLSKYGAYAQGKSVLSGTLSASGSYGSSITAYSTSVDGKTFTGSTFTVNPIANSGTLTVSVTVTDSRGRKGTASVNISVLAYASPKLTNVSAKRCDSDGTSNSSGEYLKVSFTGTITALNSKNSATYKVQYKKTSESSYTTVTLTDYTGKYSASGSYIFSADKSSSYDIIVTATDDFRSTTKQIVGSSVSKVFSILAKGLGFAFGKVAEIENALEVAWDVYCNKKLYLQKEDGEYLEVGETLLTELAGIKGVLASGTDLDNVTAPGFYLLSGSYSYSNLPSGMNFGTLEVVRPNRNNMNFLVQRISTSSILVQRFYSNSKWYTWSHIIASEDLANNLTTTASGFALDARQGKALDDKISSRANKVKKTWGTSITLPAMAHGLVIMNLSIYVVWVAGSTNAYEVNYEKVYGSDMSPTFSCNASTGVVTVKRTANTGFTYIGA